MKKFFDWVTLKFLLVGIVNTMVGTAVMFVSYNMFHLNYWISSSANYVTGSIVSFILNKKFTFHNEDRSFKVLLKFMLNISVCYLFAYGIAKPLVREMLSGVPVSVQENAAMMVGMTLFVCFNYIGQRYFAFKREE